MINRIRAYKCKSIKGFLGRKTYTKIEITNQLEMPIYDTTQLDGVLDTSQIFLLNKTKTPLKPFTRIIIELYENDVVVEKIYRVVDNDNVSNVVRGNQPIYRHTVSLVEITKILERRTVDNLTFTNYLAINGESSVVLDYFYNTISNTLNATLGPVSYNGNGRFYGPVHILGQNDTISTNISLNVSCYIKRMIFWFEFSPNEGHLELESFYVILPNSEKQQLSTNGTFTYTQAGIHKFVQKYSCFQEHIGDLGDVEYINEVSYEFTWQVECSDFSKNQKYNIRQVVERILRCHKTLLNGQDTQEFVLDSNIADKLSSIYAPEFEITQGTLFEALEQVGKYFNAIPRLIPKVNGDDDFSNWNVVTFDFLENLQEIQKTRYSLIDLENPSEGYATDFVSSVQNATISNYSGKSTTIEPCRNGFLSTRTESSIFEVSDNECIFRTREKIRSIIKVTLFYNQKIIDITSRVIEKSLYNLKSSYKQGNVYDQKDRFLYYTQGEKNIYGLSFSPTVKQNEYKTEAIKNLITGFGDGKIKDIAVNIEYIPFFDFQVKQYKTHIDNSAEESTLYYNQQANEIDVEAYGENMHYALEKTGNVKVAKTQYFKHFNNIPKCGQYVKDGNDKYVVFQTNREIITGCPVKCTTSFSKNYQQLFAQIAVKSAIRQFEISERESVERNLKVQDFCVVDTELDLNKIYNGNFNRNATAEDKEIIKRELWTGFGHPNNCNALAQHFRKETGTIDRLSTAVICRLHYFEELNKTKNILCPASFYTFGRSIVCRFSMEDNYSAGTFIDTAKTGTQDVDCGDDSVITIPAGSYAIENYIKYCNDYGKLDYLDFAFIDKFDTDNNWVKRGASYYLYDLDGEARHYFRSDRYTTSVYYGYSDSNTGSLIVDKDSRERISVTCQLNFVTPNKRIDIHKAMVDTLPYLCDSSTTYRFVVFEQEQNSDNDFVVGNFNAMGQVNALYNQQTGSIMLYTASNISFFNGESYGIITDDNRLCVSINNKIGIGYVLNPIYLMFRHNI